MTWAPQETQKTIFETLDGDLALQALLGGPGRVLDYVPDNPQFPYVTINVGQFSDRSNHSWRGWKAPVQINVWYRGGSSTTSPNTPAGRGRKQVQIIQNRIDELLHQVDICIDGWNIIVNRASTVDVFVDPDTVTLHGVQIFNLMIGEI